MCVVRLKEEHWGERFQVLVATHLGNAYYLHHHFVVNSVSFADGKRYYRSNQDYWNLRTASDRLYREYGDDGAGCRIYGSDSCLRLLKDGIEPLFPYKIPMTKEGVFKK